VSNQDPSPLSIRPGQRLRVVNLTRGELLVEELELALGPWSRLRGLIGRPALAPRAGLLLRPCRGVHTWFMRAAIDVLFLDEAGRVVALRPELRPWRMTPLFGEACCTLELAPGAIAASGTATGDQLGFEPLPETASW